MRGKENATEDCSIASLFDATIYNPEPGTREFETFILQHPTVGMILHQVLRESTHKNPKVPGISEATMQSLFVDPGNPNVTTQNQAKIAYDRQVIAWYQKNLTNLQEKNPVPGVNLPYLNPYMAAKFLLFAYYNTENGTGYKITTELCEEYIQRRESTGLGEIGSEFKRKPGRQPGSVNSAVRTRTAHPKRKGIENGTGILIGEGGSVTIYSDGDSVGKSKANKNGGGERRKGRGRNAADLNLVDDDESISNGGFDEDGYEDDALKGFDSDSWGEPDLDELKELESEAVDDLLTNDGYQDALDSDDTVGMYLKEAGRAPLLNHDQEVALAKRIEKGNKAKYILGADEIVLLMSPEDVDKLREMVADGDLAREGLTKANTRLVVSVAKRYMGRGVQFLDLIQEGNIGLIRATTKYDYHRGHRFSTYATWWIRQAVSRSIFDQGRTIRLPVHLGEAINRMSRIRLKLTQELGRDPSVEEIAIQMETTPDEVENLLEIARRPMSLETPVGDDDESVFGDFIADEDSPNPDEEIAADLLHEQLNTALNRLPFREAQILRLRFGINDGKGLTLEEVAKVIGVTRERVRQLEGQALNRLRKSSVHVTLRDYLYED